VIGLDIHHLGDNITWDAIFQQWYWFVAAAAVLVVVVGVFALLKAKSKAPLERANIAADGKDWTWTGRIDLAHPKSAEDFVLRVEETRVVNSLVGLEHREIRWRGATLDEAKTVMVSYHVQRNLAMTSNFVVSVPSETKRTSIGRGNNEEAKQKKTEVPEVQAEGDEVQVPAGSSGD
jgi:hypothetical protein